MSVRKNSYQEDCNATSLLSVLELQLLGLGTNIYGLGSVSPIKRAYPGRILNDDCMDLSDF